MKIAVLGYSGSGKSTLAGKLSSLYDIPVLHLDTVQFVPGWAERDRDEARAMVRDFMRHASWVIDGNYTDFYQPERLEQADTILFLDFPRRVCLARAFKRYLQYKNTTRESMAEGCPEKLDLEFIGWILFTGRTNKVRRHFREIVARYPGKAVVLRNQRQVDAYLRKVSSQVLL